MEPAAGVIDAALGTDWVESWRRLVEDRAAQFAPRRRPFWDDRRAQRFAGSIRDQADPFVAFLEPWLEPSRTLIDVGAGTGRHSAPLAARLDWVTAVEPSESMRSHIPAAANMTVIGSEWLDAEPAPADLVICVHVLYPIAGAVPFIRKLEASARDRVFVVMRDSRPPHPAEEFAAGRVLREPRMRDLFMLLRQVGVAPDLTMLRYPSFMRFESIDAAAEDCADRLGGLWDEREGRAWLAARLSAEGDDGAVVYDAGEMLTGVLHWKPGT